MRTKLAFTGVFAFCFGMTMAGAETPGLSKALKLIEHADSALSSANTLQAKYTDTAEFKTPYRDLRQTGTVTLSRPGLLKVEIVRARRITSADTWRDTGNNTLRVANGSEQYSAFFHEHSVQVRKADASLKAVVNEAPALTAFFSGKSSIARQLASAEESGDLKNLEVSDTEIKYSAGAVDRTIDLGEDGAIRKVVERNRDSGETHTWKLDFVRLNEPVNVGLFNYSPPKDALPFEKGGKPAQLQVGDFAPDFAATNAVGKAIHLSDYHGKVVVLKFWATWCWPCNQSLPETEALAKQFKSSGVETIALAIKDSKAGFDAWLAKHPQYGHIDFAFEDPFAQDTSKAYGVVATPTVVIIGRDGRIQAVFEGFSGPNPSISAAVQKAQS